jgi:hypothetical protein
VSQGELEKNQGLFAHLDDCFCNALVVLKYSHQTSCACRRNNRFRLLCACCVQKAHIVPRPVVFCARTCCCVPAQQAACSASQSPKGHENLTRLCVCVCVCILGRMSDGEEDVEALEPTVLKTLAAVDAPIEIERDESVSFADLVYLQALMRVSICGEWCLCGRVWSRLWWRHASASITPTQHRSRRRPSR